MSDTNVAHCGTRNGEDGAKRRSRTYSSIAKSSFQGLPLPGGKLELLMAAFRPFSDTACDAFSPQRFTRGVIAQPQVHPAGDQATVQARWHPRVLCVMRFFAHANDYHMDRKNPVHTLTAPLLRNDEMSGTFCRMFHCEATIRDRVGDSKVEVLSYAFARRFPALISGEGEVKTPCNTHLLCDARYCLREISVFCFRYAVCGTEMGHAATRKVADDQERRIGKIGSVLCIRYALSGTDRRVPCFPCQLSVLTWRVSVA
eukprot:980209-Rhodomonas_salina.3